ncbi:helix-turn-helix domain-containing protein [Saccharopolyspora phatthalungensis]|uniref:Transcriptional regulator with XRE-family HTH domain n=1 Tax=Saccharopolyspora phatthalungensis TaxID=664693 RepID=A0A840PXV0_9PSEU|nr:helix-turn-helix transcriptional regulator [Saccharopolyspora phatthalungensis]MBB5153136.1 transcriptional regulator with XRE-family HTH domain [Saccharopolyspora phatthalungensis]
MPTPTVRRLQLGHELRHLREDAGCDLGEAGRAIGKAESTISRLESGQTGLKRQVLEQLVEFYASKVRVRVDRSFYLGLAKGSEQRGRWTGYRAIYHKYARMMVDLEADASVINHYQCEFLPGLVQTPGYIQAMRAEAVRQVVPDMDDVFRARAERQEIFTKEEAPDIGFVLSESALRTMVGTSDVMREQLEHVAKISELPNVQLQVLPFDARIHAAARSQSFMTFRIEAPGNSGPLEFVYLEEHHDGKYLDNREDVELYNRLWSRMVGAALDPVASRDKVLEVAESY